MSFKNNAFPIGKGKLNINTGVRTDNLSYWCRVDGILTITWSDATTTAISLVAGEAVNIESTATSVTITSGTWHIA